MGRLLKVDPATATRISEHRRIISFRNVLIHGYSAIDNEIVWSIVETKLPILRAEVDALLAQPDDHGPAMANP